MKCTFIFCGHLQKTGGFSFLDNWEDSILSDIFNSLFCMAQRISLAVTSQATWNKAIAFCHSVSQGEGRVGQGITC